MNFSEAMFYENYLTSDFHANTVISRRVCLPIKMASKIVLRSMLITANQVLTVCQGLFILSKNERQKILSYFNKS